MTDWTDVLGGAAKGAAAGAFLGPIGAGAGGLIGLASSLVPHVFGEDATPILAAAAKAITGADDEAGQVQVLSSDGAALAQFKVQALQIAKDREQAQLDAQSNDIANRLADTQDARKTTVDLAKAGSTIAWGAPAVSILAVAAFGSAVAIILLHAVPESSKEAANVLLGALAAGFVQTLNYWLGSSAGSASKDVRLANSVPASMLHKPLTSEPK
jgi:hypothetical protein